MVEPAVQVAAIGVLAAVVGPLLLSWLNARNASKGKEQDYARQDAVAAAQTHAAQAASHAADAALAATRAAALQAEVAAGLLVQENMRRTAVDVQQSSKLDTIEAGQRQIHTLVNSNLTSSMERELVALLSLQALLTRVTNPDPTTTEALATVAQQVRSLRIQLKDRDLATQLGATQARQAPSEPVKVTIVPDPEAPLPVEVRPPHGQ